MWWVEGICCGKTSHFQVSLWRASPFAWTLTHLILRCLISAQAITPSPNSATAVCKHCKLKSQFCTRKMKTMLAILKCFESRKLLEHHVLRAKLDWPLDHSLCAGISSNKKMQAKRSYLTAHLNPSTRQAQTRSEPYSSPRSKKCDGTGLTDSFPRISLSDI